MADIKTKPKLGFPGMLDKKYQVHHDKLVRVEAAAKKIARAALFKAAADKILPSWDV